jgi:hypothetical protein
MASMSDPILSWLLEESNPSVRFHTLTSFLGRAPETKEANEARHLIMDKGAVPVILASQNEDGSWGLPERFYVDKYTGTVWNVLILAELAANPKDPRVIKACEFILNHSQNPESGGFSYMQSKKTGNGLASGVIPCLCANMVYSLIKLGYLEDKRVQQAISWITLYQRADDGIDQPPKGPMYDRMGMCWGRHSCHMGVAKSLKALAAIPPEKRNADVTMKINQMAEYFLLHHLYRKSRKLEEISRPGWLKLGFPLMYQTDILELLGIFHDLHIDDPRLEDAKDILKRKQDPNGTWKLENTFNGKMLVTIEKKGQPSKWITMKALKILQPHVE